MIELPAFARELPAVYTTAGQNAHAARCALLIAPEGPIAPVKHRRGPVEQAQLQTLLAGWMHRHARDLQIFEPRLQLSLDDAPTCVCTQNTKHPMALWVGNRNGDAWNRRWRLERRWTALQKEAPGMPAAALDALGEASRAGLPIYTPQEALGHCSWQHWYGEADERYALRQAEEDGLTAEEAEEEGFPTRRWLEAQLPPLAPANRRAMARKRLEQSWGPRRDVARAILNLLQAVKANGPGSKGPSLHDHEDELWCVGYGVTLRWSPDDPMARLYDDFANGLFEAFQVDEAYGWFPVAAPENLPIVLAALERRFTVARAAEKLIQLIAEEGH